MTRVLYLTGSTGYIGRLILERCDEDELIVKVYCPVRTKKGSTGQERFDARCSHLKKACFVEPSAPIPIDVTHVVLNAYDVKFFNPIDRVLAENVKPMLHLLDQCRSLLRLEGISVVSTAYVQQPLPFKRDPHNRIDFILKKEGVSASKLYHGLLTDANVTKSKFHHTLPECYQLNSYAFSKHIMEHLIRERFPDLPVCIVRPSIVAHSRDGKHGHDGKSGFPLCLAITPHPLVLFPRNEGNMDLVFVEDVVTDILLGATEYAAPVVKVDGTGFHPILLSTSGSTREFLSNMELFHLMAPMILRFDIRNSHLLVLLRSIELLAVRMMNGKRTARGVQLCYDNYDQFFSHSWDFETRRKFDKMELKTSLDCFYGRNEIEVSPEVNKATKINSMAWIKLFLDNLMSSMFVFKD